MQSLKQFLCSYQSFIHNFNHGFYDLLLCVVSVCKNVLFSILCCNELLDELSTKFVVNDLIIHSFGSLR